MKTNNCLVSFNVAKFAKAKGFDYPTLDYYMGSGKIYQSYVLENHNISGITKEKYSAPTHEQLLNWLKYKDVDIEYHMIDMLKNLPDIEE